MQVFAVFKEGIYRHECGGVFSTLVLAREAAHKLIVGERDDHHKYSVIPFTLDAVTKQTEKNNRARHDSTGKRYLSGGDLLEPFELLEMARDG
jgi:hypothetical protein